MKLYGKNTCFERLRCDPKSIKKVYVQHGFQGTLYVHKKAKQWGIPVLPVAQSKMMKMGRDKNVQGILIDVEDFKYIPYDELLDTAIKNKRTLVFLDGLNDPQNLGAIIRSLACLGKFSLVLPTHGSVSVTESVLRVASGGDNYVPTSKVSNLSKAIRQAQARRFKIVGTVVKEGESINNAELSGPIGVVVGSEQKGIRDAVRKCLDIQLSIPMACHTLSLNVAHATAIICYEITKQKKSAKSQE